MRILYCPDKDNNSYAVYLCFLCHFLSSAVECFCLPVETGIFIFEVPGWPSMNVISI